MEKRERASKKIQEDSAIFEQRKQDINKLKSGIVTIKEAKKYMDKKIREYSLFEKFLEETALQTGFMNTSDVINRYLSLLNAKNYLANRQETNLKSLETARSDMVRYSVLLICQKYFQGSHYYNPHVKIMSKSFLLLYDERCHE